jgi:putative membrane protein insertion efficiency factor
MPRTNTSNLTSSTPAAALPHASDHALVAELTVPQRAALALLRGYKLAFSPLYAGSCRYLPSCSDYAADAVRVHGVLRGSWLAVRRLARCHPLGGHGLDPVPGRK